MPVFLEGYGESEGIYKIAIPRVPVYKSGNMRMLHVQARQTFRHAIAVAGSQVIGPRSVVVVSDPVVVKRILTSSPDRDRVERYSAVEEMPRIRLETSRFSCSQASMSELIDVFELRQICGDAHFKA